MDSNERHLGAPAVESCATIAIRLASRLRFFCCLSDVPILFNNL
jgi:hypothetical protein